MIRATYVVAQLLLLFAFDVLAAFASLVQLALNLRFKLLHAFSYSLTDTSYLLLLNVKRHSINNRTISGFYRDNSLATILTCSLRRSSILLIFSSR